MINLTWQENKLLFTCSSMLWIKLPLWASSLKQSKNLERVPGSQWPLVIGWMMQHHEYVASTKSMRLGIAEQEDLYYCNTNRFQQAMSL